jgi:hypothetical protein
MDIVDSKEIKKIKEARTKIDEQQKRIWKLEHALADLARASEIAQYSQQYNVVETYRIEAEELLQDRLTAPELDQTQDPLKIRIYKGGEDMNEKIHDHVTQKSNQAAGHA